MEPAGISQPCPRCGSKLQFGTQLKVSGPDYP